MIYLTVWLTFSVLFALLHHRMKVLARREQTRRWLLASVVERLPTERQIIDNGRVRITTRRTLR
jgi:putative SOS response-associated peptidase YedK